MYIEDLTKAFTTYMPYCNGPSEPKIGSERQHESAVFLAQMKQWHFLNEIDFTT